MSSRYKYKLQYIYNESFWIDIKKLTKSTEWKSLGLFSIIKKSSSFHNYCFFLSSTNNFHHSLNMFSPCYFWCLKDSNFAFAFKYKIKCVPFISLVITTFGRYITYFLYCTYTFFQQSLCLKLFSIMQLWCTRTHT